MEAGDAVPSFTEMKSIITEAKAIEAATPDLPPAEKAAAVKTAFAAKKDTVNAAPPNGGAEPIAAASNAGVAEHAEQAALLIIENLSDDAVTEFVGHCEAAGWHDLAAGLKKLMLEEAA